jgi:HEAT repeat protein
MAEIRPSTLNGVPIPYDAPIADLRVTIGEYGSKAGAAIRALAEKPEEEALTALIEFSKSSDPYLRRASIEAIGIHRSGRTALEVICQALRDPNVIVVRAAIEAAAGLRLQPAHQRVLELATVSEESTRVVALRALEVLWQSSDFESVFAIYLHDPSDTVRKQAAWTIRENICAEHWERAFRAWANDALPRHRMWACEIGGRFGSKSVLLVLKELLTDADGHVRDAAQLALQKIGNLGNGDA